MDKLDQPLDELVAKSGGRTGKAERAGGGRRRDTPYENTAGRRHLQGASLDDIAAAPPTERVLKVSASTQAKTLAGSICYVTRNGGPPTLLPLGAACVNQAVKGVAIARKLLADEGLDLSCFPTFRDSHKNTLSLRLASFPTEEGGGGGGGGARGEVVLTVASSSNPATVAGAIAAKVREMKPVATSSVGADSVHAAVLAVAHAAEYLRDEGVRICCMPRFANEEGGKGDALTTVRLDVGVVAGSA